MKYSDLIQFATVRQIEYIEAIEKFGGIIKAAKGLGKPRAQMSRGSVKCSRFENCEIELVTCCLAQREGWCPNAVYSLLPPIG